MKLVAMEWLERHILALVLLVIVGFSAAHLYQKFNLSCWLQKDACLQVDSRWITLENALQIIDDCEAFDNRRFGILSLSLSTSEISKINEGFKKQTGIAVSPLLKSFFAYGALYDSSLPFDRGEVDPTKQYLSVRLACRQLAAAASHY